MFGIQLLRDALFSDGARRSRSTSLLIWTASTAQTVSASEIAFHLAQQLLERGIGLGAQRSRLHVMQFGLLLGGRLVGGVNDREIEMRIRVIGIRRDRVEHFLFRRLLPALLARGNAKIIMRRRALRIDPERFRQLRDRIVILALAIINNPERGMRKFILRRQRHRFLQRQLRRLQFAGAEIDHPQIRE